jgi:hypothetical protein
MIDKSIRQYYQNGKKAGPFKKGIKTIWDPIKKTYINPLIDTTTGEIDKSEVVKTLGKSLGKSYLKKAAAKKLGVASLNPLVGLLSLVMPWIKQKWGEGGAKQAFTAGIMGPEWADLGSRELRQLEKRRDYMLRRKAENKTYSKKNLEEVTNQINEIKKTKNVIEEVTADDPFAWPETTGGDEVSVGYEEGQVDPNLARHIPKDSPISQFPGEDEIILQQRKQEAMFPGEDEIIQQQIEQRNRLAEQRERDRLQREVTLEAERNAQRLREQQAAIPPPEQHGGGGGGQDYGQRETRSSSGWQSSPFKKGGRVDKALGGRSRDI